MIIGYARVSMRTQNEDRQVDDLTAAGCERIYTDKISSRRDFQERPEWVRMWDTLRAGDVLLATELDRIGRSLTDLLNIVAECEKRGVALRFLRGPFAGDLTQQDGTPGQLLTRQLLLVITATFAEYERALNRSRTLDGLQAARARGRKGGRKDKLTPIEAQLVASLYHAKSVPVKQIGQQFGIGPDAVRRYAKRHPSEEKLTLSQT